MCWPIARASRAAGQATVAQSRRPRRLRRAPAKSESPMAGDRPRRRAIPSGPRLDSLGHQHPAQPVVGHARGPAHRRQDLGAAAFGYREEPMRAVVRVKRVVRSPAVAYQIAAVRAHFTVDDGYRESGRLASQMPTVLQPQFAQGRYPPGCRGKTCRDLSKRGRRVERSVDAATAVEVARLQLMS